MECSTSELEKTYYLFNLRYFSVALKFKHSVSKSYGWIRGRRDKWNWRGRIGIYSTLEWKRGL